MFMIHGYKGRTREWAVTLKESDGTELTLAADDVVRVKIGRTTNSSPTPSLDLSSIAQSANGSSVDPTPLSGDVVLTLAAADLENLEQGAYDIEFAVVDNSQHDAGVDAIKHAESGVFYLHPTLGGSTGEESSSS